MLGCDSTGAAERSCPVPRARGGGLEEQPLIQGEVAAQASEGQVELFHVGRGGSEENSLIQGKQ